MSVILSGCGDDDMLDVCVCDVAAGCGDDDMLDVCVGDVIAGCRDESDYCSVVKMMKLCRYANFKHKCCASCRRRRQNKS